MIEVSHLTKVYREGRGIRNVSFRVEQGTAFGFLGPNGAGKTTTIRLLMGFMKADAGEAKISGLDCWQNRTDVKKLVGYLPGELHFMDNLTGLEFLVLIEGMHGEAQGAAKRRGELLAALDLNPELLIRKMSKGMKQKLGLVAALMLDAQILILDEPTSGLDPLMQKTFIDLILEEKKNGKTIFMSSHQFAEIERTCDQVGIMRAGQLLTVKNITELKQDERQNYELEVESEADLNILRQSGLDVRELGELRAFVHVSGQMDLLWLTLAQIRVKGFKQRALELEEAFMDYYRPEQR